VFRERYGHGETFDGVRFHGMTDRAIVRGGLERVGGPVDDATIDAICEAYLLALAEEVPRAEGFRVFAGVETLLDALAGRDALAIGLGTGNLREGARVKIERAGIAHHFPFGGFGCDHEHRPTIVRIAAERGAARLGVPLDACRVVVIGDTPLDVDAARAIGADCVAVTTGGIDAATLAGAGATRVFDDLASDGVLAALVDG